MIKISKIILVMIMTLFFWQLRHLNFHIETYAEKYNFTKFTLADIYADQNLIISS